MEQTVLTAGSAEAGLRIDKFVLDAMPDMTRNQIQLLLAQGLITVQDKAVAKNYRLRQGDTVTVCIPPPKELDTVAQEIPLDIRYEDEDCLVVNKPKGMVVHPAAGNADGTLVNALLFHCGDSLSGINGVVRPGIVHRIDKDTSGLLIVAKNDNAHQKLAAQIKEHSFTRVYEAVVTGNLRQDEGVIDAPIGRHPKERKKQAVTERNARNAVTHYRVLHRYPGFTHVECRLETGRTHQIRVHMAYLGHPLAGDTVYGAKKDPFALHGQCLHARTLGFRHPRDGRYVEVTSELPPYFTAFLHRLQAKE